MRFLPVGDRDLRTQPIQQLRSRNAASRQTDDRNLYIFDVHWLPVIEV